MTMRIVSGVFALRRIVRSAPRPTSFVSVASPSAPGAFLAAKTVSSFATLVSFTHSVANSGRYFETGSSSEILPSSTSFATVTPQKPFVCEHCMNGSSSPIGRCAATSA